MQIQNEILYSFINTMYEKKDFMPIYNKFIKNVEVVTPDVVFGAMNQLLVKGATAEEILPIVDKVINVLHKKLSNYAWDKPADDTFLFYLREENKNLEEKLDSFRPLIKNQSIFELKAGSKNLVGYLDEYNTHLLKLENILFPAMEKKHDSFLGLSIMWALHDKARDMLKKAKIALLGEDVNIKSINKAIGELYFQYYGLSKKQELLLFPAAVKWIDKKDLMNLHVQSFDFGFSYIDVPEKPEIVIANTDIAKIIDMKFVTNTGSLDIEMLRALMSCLPFDITVVDENDKVVYFSDSNERIFHRSASVIGRNVKNCHPPKSLPIVKQIFNSFKENKKDIESFWINIKGKTVLIKYLALRNDDGKYLGTLEISQDITEIKNLKGERRLLDSNP
ncbi:MAG: DUF438 domain-containing protein [Clostridiales bacterium]|nr:DUF438 domain-containing protein [Clostridiales bacterium]